MIELKNLQSIDIPAKPEREWIWRRILISIDYFILKRPTALQWALIKILSNKDKMKADLTTDKVAQKLAVENSIIEEGLTDLIDEHLITLQPRKDPSILQYYTVNEIINFTFTKHELITQAKSNKKIILFYDYKDDRTYAYQVVEKPDGDLEGEEVDLSIFELILLALIEQIWKDLESDPHRLVGEIDFPSVLDHKFLKNLSSILIERVHVNFL